jgi:glycosyltransferase involved in cell wall biosynthesis
MNTSSTPGSLPRDSAVLAAEPRRPKLTGVIPAYNAAEVVTESINSLLRQTVPLDEIVVVDDGSTDDTAMVAERTGVRVIRQANAGPGGARNAAIRATDADWIVLLDADDVADPERVAIQSAHLGNPDVAVVCAPARKMPGTRITHELLWERNQVITSTVFLRRSAWEAAGGFNESRALIGVEDYNLWLRLTRSGWNVVRIDQPLVRYSRTETSLTRQIERFVKAELANVIVLAEEFGLTPEEVRAKEYRILLQYGLDMFHERNLGAARNYLSAAAHRGTLSWSNRLRLSLSNFPVLARMLP